MSTGTDDDINDIIDDPAIDNRELRDLIDEHLSDGRSGGRELLPITPEEAVKRYLRRRSNELAESSMATHRSSLNHFTRWCDLEEIDNLNTLNGRKIQEYLDWRVEEAPTSVDELAAKSEKTQIDITRKFIEICVAIDAVPAGLHERIPSFRISKGEDVCEEILERDRVEEVLKHLETYHFASRNHIIWLLLAEFGPRIGALRSFDVKDFLPDEKALKLRNRPAKGTRLKNGDASERSVALLRDKSVEAIQAFIEEQRVEISDEYDRRPLLTTRSGRIGSSTIRKIVYRWSCPTAIGNECEHDEEMTTSDAWSCPNNVSAHPLRRGTITHLLRNEIPINVISSRCDVSPRVIELHYDGRDEGERRSTRRRVITDHLNGEDSQ